MARVSLIAEGERRELAERVPRARAVRARMRREALRPHSDDRELVELTATIGGCNLVSRFLEAMRIEHEI